MGNITAKLAVGPVNFTDYVIAIIRKVSDPTVEIDRQVFGPAPTSLNLVFTELDPETYFVDFRDSTDGIDIGVLISTFTIDAQSNQLMQEKRYYTVGGSGDYDPADGDSSITDPYFEGKNVSCLFKEGFRDLKPDVEWERTGNTLNNLTGVAYSTNEVIVVTIDYKDALPVTSVGGGGLFVDTKTITANTTLDSTYYNNRIKLTGSAATLVVTLQTLATIPDGKYFYFNTFGGSQIQTVIKCSGSDKIFFDGFDLVLNEFGELWIGKGEFIWIEKRGSYFEVIDCSKSIVEVGEIVTLGYKSHPNIIPEDGRLLDGEEYPRLWWWVSNLPSTHVVSTDTVISGGYTHDATKPGMFVKHTTLKKFRMPLTEGLMHKGLADFITYGGDTTNRPVDYPGGFQDESLLAHTHEYKRTRTDTIGTIYEANHMMDGANRGLYTGDTVNTSSVGGTQNRVKNIGVIFGRRI